ncbi:carbon starvation CstA family protein [Chitinophaga japonensis]|uniref:Carbon starvation protein CstA n=1 Tax=Chitinophaga japonensis TaxID=104662 RepID=A0A562SIE0_CHIJA|nr:carbon starvation protein A [Chitinophaga japonensis]TWI81012.1 carbon starvation protein CstA [Chitinophaga japonensis]
MITFFASIFLLLAGYFIYARVCEKIFGMDPQRKTPAETRADRVDYIVMPGWKIFLIQFLNIAGLGPIFGAVAGAMWGPVAFLWIVLGCIFAGGVHDYFSGMLSIRHDGQSFSEISGIYLGNGVRQFMRGFSVVLLIMVGTVFIMGPARILSDLTNGFGGTFFWTALIFIYYVLSTILPIDKLIGRIYPVFGVTLLFMAAGIMVMMVYNRLPVPELTLGSFENMHIRPDKFPVFPMLLITIACGAVSGFHATQSPLMARCIRNERQGRGIFFGAMVTEGIVALIWAAISMSFFGGIRELNATMDQHAGNAAWAVNEISRSLLGRIGGVLAILGVVAAPVTSGDTAFRSARLIIADFLQLEQASLKKRLWITVPLFAVGFLLTQLDFAIVWRYFAWTNQTLAMIVLWTITMYLVRERKFYWVALVPAFVMTVATVSYILVAPEGFSLPVNASYIAGLAAGVALLVPVVREVNRYGSVYKLAGK